MFERFTDASRRVLVLAQNEARLLSHSFVGTEHLLLALLHGDQGLPAEVLTSQGITLDLAREKVARMVGPNAAEASGAQPFTPRAKRALEAALREALQLGHHDIASEHLLLGLLRDDGGVAIQVIREFGVQPRHVREVLLRRAGDAPSPTPAPAGAAPLEPRCPTCLHAIAAVACYRRLEIPSAEPERDERQMVIVVYYGRCGSVLPASLPPPQPDQ